MYFYGDDGLVITAGYISWEALAFAAMAAFFLSLDKSEQLQIQTFVVIRSNPPFLFVLHLRRLFLGEVAVISARISSFSLGLLSHLLLKIWRTVRLK